jgi:hypothetical protein
MSDTDWHGFVDPRATVGAVPPPILRLPAGATVDDAGRAVGQLLRQVRWLRTFWLFVGDEAVGLTSRAFLRGRPAGPASSPLIPHECRDPACRTIEYRVSYDADDMPVCGVCGRRMGLVR